MNNKFLKIKKLEMQIMCIRLVNYIFLYDLKLNYIRFKSTFRNIRIPLREILRKTEIKCK